MIILQKQKETDQSILKLQRKFKLFDISLMKVEFEILISYKPLMGRLESGQYTFVDGHIYYSNHVIKIRYDLIQSQQAEKYSEMQIFDFYDNIFQLEKNETVKASTPLDSYRSHRFGYVITSKEYLPKKVMITPYLHDKRIYLNRLKINTDYFYTSIESDVPSGITGCKETIKALKNNKLDY